MNIFQINKKWKWVYGFLTNKANMFFFKYKTILRTKSKTIFFYNLVYIFLLLLSYSLYFLSLEKCLEGQVLCSQKNRWIHKKLIEAIASAIIISFLLELILLKISSIINLIHISIVFCGFFIYSHGLDFYDHGLFNLIGLIAIIIIIIFFLLPLNCLIYLIKKKNFILILVFFLFLFFFILFYYYNIFTYLECKDWNKGLNNTYIENNENKYGCQIIIPKYCPYKVGKYFLDITKKAKIKCGNVKDAKNKLLKYSKSKNINENTTKIGFPLTNDRKITKVLPFVQHNLIDMDNKDFLKRIGKEKYPEVVIDFSENPLGKMNINVNFNESLSKERKKKEKNSKPYSNNIMILYFDSVSRSNAIRQLKLTLQFIEKFMSYKGNYNKKYPSENYHSFQFFKYHSFFRYTRGNYLKLFYGSDSSPKMIRIIKYLKENGYITAFSNDICMRESCSTSHKYSQNEISDHELILCDPNQKNTNSMVIKCLYDKINVKYQYEFGEQFWRKYNKNRRFLLLVNNDGHEGTLEIIKYDDEIIFNFLNSLFNDNMLKETTVLLLSDHGCPMPSLYYFYQFFKLEKYLPMFFILIADHKNNSYNKQYKYILENQQKLITPYDIYNNSKKTPYNYRGMSKLICLRNKKKK